MRVDTTGNVGVWHDYPESDFKIGSGIEAAAPLEGLVWLYRTLQVMFLQQPDDHHVHGSR